MKATIRDALSVGRNPCAWPGGYPRYLLMDDGGALCPKCVRENRSDIIKATLRGYRSGWAAAGSDINWEDHALRCDHCNAQIEAAYSSDGIHTGAEGQGENKTD